MIVRISNLPSAKGVLVIHQDEISPYHEPNIISIENPHNILNTIFDHYQYIGMWDNTLWLYEGYKIFNSI